VGVDFLPFRIERGTAVNAGLELPSAAGGKTIHTLSIKF